MHWKRMKTSEMFRRVSEFLLYKLFALSEVRNFYSIKKKKKEGW